MEEVQMKGQRQALGRERMALLRTRLSTPEWTPGIEGMMVGNINGSMSVGGNTQGIHTLKPFPTCGGKRTSHSLAKTKNIARFREHGPNAQLAEEIQVLRTYTTLWPQTITRVSKWAEILETN